MVKQQNGFTLIEIILVIIILAVIAGVGAQFIVKPLLGYLSVSERITQKDDVVSALHLITHELSHAVPHSVRLSADHHAIEFIPMEQRLRYRDAPAKHDPSLLPLYPSEAVSRFDVLGRFERTYTNSTAIRLIIGKPSTEALYRESNAMTPRRLPITLINDQQQGHVVLGERHRFDVQSLQPFVTIVRTPVMYMCDRIVGKLVRYQDYPLSAQWRVPDNTTPDPILKQVTACQFKRLGKQHILLDLTIRVGKAGRQHWQKQVVIS